MIRIDNFLSRHVKHKEGRYEDKPSSSVSDSSLAKDSQCLRRFRMNGTALPVYADRRDKVAEKNEMSPTGTAYCPQKMLFLLGIMATFAQLSSGVNLDSLKKSTGLSLRQVDNPPLQIFGHTVRVQQSVTEHHQNRGSRKHRRRGKGHSDKAVTRCPPPMSRLPDEACTVNPCLSDSECPFHGESCCYNGCIYTCVHVVHPPPVIDWQTRLLGFNKSERLDEFDALQPTEYEGNIEFDIVPGEMLAESHRGAPIGEICSTTVEDGDILLDCPHGYICHVEDKGNPSKGIPDRGRCLSVNENVQADTHILQDEYFY